MARHDREDPHSLEDQLAWLDAIKEMPDEVDIAVSAVTSASLAPAPLTEPEVPSPYPQDPWRSVPSEPASQALFRTATDPAYGATVVVAPAGGAADTSGSSAGLSGSSGSSGSGGSGLSEDGGLPGFPGTPPAGLGRGPLFQDSPVDTDSFNVGAFGESDVRTSYKEHHTQPVRFPTGEHRLEDLPSDESGSEESRTEASKSDEPVRGWLEPAVPVVETDGSSSTGSSSTGTSGSLNSGTGTSGLSGFGSSGSGFSGSGVPGSGLSESGVSGGVSGSGSSGSGASGSDSGTPFSGGLLGAVTERFTGPFPEETPVEERKPYEGERSFGGSLHEETGGQSFGGFSREETGGQSFGVLGGDLPPGQPFGGSLRDDLAPGQPFGGSSREGFGGSPHEETVGQPFGGSLRDDLAPAQPFGTAPSADPLPDRRSDGTSREAPSPTSSEDQALEEREPYQPRRRQAPAVTTFGAPGRTSGAKAGGKPSADSLDPGSLLKGRRNAPARGWRRFVYKASGGWIKPGEAPDVRRRRELISRARTPVATGHHRVAVLSLKGGVGKTTTTVGLGATLAQIRGDRVIAVDANPDRGTLSDKVELETSATVRDLLNERSQIKRYVDIRAFTSQAPSRLEILASDRDPSVSEAFSATDYQAVAQVLENFYSICITDCGTGLLHSAMSGVLDLADQLVLVSSPSVDGARAASATLDWLEAHNHAELVRAATVVLCSVRPRSKSAVDLDRLEGHFAARCRSVIRVPYDPHLEEGAEIDLDRLLEPTREAYLRLAAAVGDGFAGPQAIAERRYSEIPDQI
ncbi:MinD/ParA family ATP-binding protein [Microtetraspora glauca]|uniref:MinD/ParA family protein n=1 Tax=Microtetraspora glauca TaxID=1996 RepID=A0ABV3GJB6_MICGL